MIGNRSTARASLRCGIGIALLALGLLSPVSVSSAAAASPPSATTGAAYVAQLGNTFATHLPTTWKSVVGAWMTLDPLACWQSGASCNGSNPATPYGYPTFPLNGVQENYFQLNPNDAVVIFTETPPQVAYYGFTQYLTALPGQAPVFASLSDSLNLSEIVTLGGAGPGQNQFNSFAVIVWTANINTYNDIVSILGKEGIAAANINFIPLPINMGTYPGWTGKPVAPLPMGTGSNAALFNMLMRAALPASQTDWQNYLAADPFYVIKVSPPASLALNPAPSVGFASPTTGILESTSQQTLPALQQALNDLVSNIRTASSAVWNFSTLLEYTNTIGGWECITQNLQCGDNHDELSTLDSATSVSVKTLHDIVIIAGVNHAVTNKGLYFNHTIYDLANGGAVTSFSNLDLTSASALYWADVTSPTDPRVQEYQTLWAYAISYNCTGLQYCLQIPQPTATNPVGLPLGYPFALSGRVVEDPVRIDAPLNVFVRPSTSEVVMHQTLLGSFITE